ncbi:MAG: GLUG motif-containing protein [Planctomycetota bacterium]|jgi:hypothetical protein
MVGVQKRKIQWAISLFLVMLYFSGLTAQAQYSGSTGEPNDPYQIATAEDLILLGESPEDYDKHFILTADIDLDPNLPGRKVFEKAVIPPQPDPNFGRTPKTITFTGVFDGSGHTISHLTIRGVDTLGLFGRLGSGAMVSNLSLEAVDVNGAFGVGGLVGISSGTVTDCQSTGSVSGISCVGGLVGCNGGSIMTSCSTSTVTGDFSSIGGLVGESSGRITASYSAGTVTGNLHVGGLVGTNGGSITAGSSTGKVTGNTYVSGLVGWNEGSVAQSSSTGMVNGDYSVGGLVGENRHGGSITTSYSTGTVTGSITVGGLAGDNFGSITVSYSTSTVTGHNLVGGLVAWNVGHITTSYSTGTVTGKGDGANRVGGLVGDNFGSITTSYSTGMVTGSIYVGGLVGINSGGSITTSYSTGSVSGNSDVGGLVGENGEGGSITSSFWDMESSGLLTSDGGITKTTAEMQTASTFLDAGWDFVDETANGTEDIWWILEGQDYPQLWWEYFIVVDDFESYNDLDPTDPDSNRIFETWIDGWGIPENGSIVGYEVVPPIEYMIVHGGRQSMPLFYNNSGPANYSEATANIAKLANDHDWTIEGVGVLSLWFYGDPNNAPEPMYVAITNSGSSPVAVYYNNPEALLIEDWTEWRIDLQEFAALGVNLTSVDSISIGFGDKNNPQLGGSGMVWFDDIRLYRLAPEPAP